MKPARPSAPILVDPPASAELAADASLPLGLQSVCRTLAETDAHLQRFAWLGDHLAIAEWTRDTEVAETSYDRPGHHTLSCYLDGGYRTERHKLPGRYGAPSRLCALPGDHESRWWVRGQMHFMHLYFQPEHFTRRAVRELDREPRELDLADRTYFEHPQIAELCRSLLHETWDDVDGRLRANETAHDVLSLLLRDQGVSRAGQRIGGLAPATRRRVRDYVDAALDQPITLGELAELAALSEYHFARMFRVSFGAPPHAWIAEQRLARARALLRDTALPLAQVAAQCGYADPAHFSHRFRAAHGVAPTAYRRALRGG